MGSGSSMHDTGPKPALLGLSAWQGGAAGVPQLEKGEAISATARHLELDADLDAELDTELDAQVVAHAMLAAPTRSMAAVAL
jgi:hypothetical protein